MQRLSKFFLCIILCLSFSGGCKSNEYISIEEWLNILSVKTGLSNETSKSLDNLVKWGVELSELELSHPLTKEVVAYVFDAWIAFDNSTVEFRDIDDATYTNAIMNVVEYNLMKLDEHQRFYPLRKCTYEEAMTYLDDFLFYVNQKEFDSLFEYEIDQDFNTLEVKPFKFNEELLEATFPFEYDMSKVDVVTWDSQGKTHIYEVEKVENGTTKLKESSIEVFEELHISDTLELDFSNAEIIPSNNEPLVYDPLGIETVGYSDHQFKYKDYLIRYNFSTSSISFSAYKDTAYDAKLFSKITIQNFKPSFNWNMEKGVIENAYFKVNFNSLLEAGITKGNYQALSLDFSKLNKDELLSSLTSAWSSARSTIDEELPLAQIRIPVANIPTLSVVLDLSLRLYFNGTVELLCTMNHQHGFEVNHNQLRLINELNHDIDFLLKASAGVSSKVTVAANMMNVDLANLAISAGIKGNMSTTLHLPDQTTHISIEDIPYDVLDEVMKRDEGYTLCGDLSAYWDVHLMVNSIGTLAGKLGLGKTITLLDKNNASLFNGAIQHIENMQFVNECTRKKIINQEIPVIQTDVDRIILENYSMLCRVNEPRYVQIRGIPDGFKLSDIQFKSSDSKIASVNEVGLVEAHSEGTARISVYLDEENIVLCNILVRE